MASDTRIPDSPELQSHLVPRELLRDESFLGESDAGELSRRIMSRIVSTIVLYDRVPPPSVLPSQDKVPLEERELSLPLQADWVRHAVIMMSLVDLHRRQLQWI